ncbi:MAG: S24/S26 family peptidase [Acidobacteria bacterium]|nr:S24/S26 family peptidase [Acidobacteriota bacterium]
MSEGIEASRVEQVAEAMRARGAARLRVFGTSMLPWIRPGDLLHILRTDLDRICLGEIILFTRDGRLFVHRVIRKDQRPGWPLLVTKGDALPHADAPLSDLEFLGCVISIDRSDRRIDLQAPGQIALGRLLSRFSVFSRFWFPVARLAKRLLLPARGAASRLLPPSLPGNA